MKTFFSDHYGSAWRNLLRAVRPLVLFEFWFGLLYTFILIPPAAWLLNRLITAGGQAAISNQQLIDFFTSARGLLFILLASGFALAFWYLEQIGLFIIARSAAEDRHISVNTVMWRNMSRMPALIRLGLLQALIYAAACLPFILGIGLTYLIFLGGRDINYYLSAQPWQWWTALGIAGVLALLYLLAAAWLFVRCLFAVPILVFENTRAVEALRKSWKRTRHRFWPLGMPLAVWWLFILAASFLTVWLIRSIVAYLMPQAGLNLAVILPLVLGGLALTALAAAAWLIIGKAVYASLVITFYGETAEKPLKPRQESRLSKLISPAGLRRAAWLGAGIALAAAVISGILMLKNLDLDHRVEVTAHRGSSFTAPENTMAALKQAAADGAGYAEIDVQTTADGEVILMHDGDLMRVASVNRRIQDMSWEALKDIDIGSWFSPDFSRERTPTLEQAIAFARGRIRLNIELKYNRPDPELAVSVARIIRRNDFAGECVITSLDYAELRRLKELIPEIEAGLIVFRALGDVVRTEADFLSMHAAQATRRLVKRAHRRGMEIHVWTVNDLQTTLSMIEVGVDNIITDDPPLVLNVIRAWQELTDAEKIALMLRRLFLEADPSLIKEL
jgi:glycerophosphoryl diester phosphodiesterase